MRASPISISVHGTRWLDYLSNHGRAESTIWTYRHCLRWFSEWLEDRCLALARVTRAAVEDWISTMRMAGRHLKSIRSRVGVVRGFYSWLTMEGLLQRDPLLGLGHIKVPRSLPQVLQKSHVRQLMVAAHTPRERVVLRILYATGCRRSEILSIKLQDLDLDRRMIRIRGKGSKDRLVLYDRPTATAIRNWLAVRAKIVRTWKTDAGFLIVGREGPLHGQRLLDIVHAIAGRAGIDRRVYVHAFRHAFASHSLDDGMKIEEVKELLGHESIATTQVYTHVSLERLRSSYDRARAAAL